MTALKTYCCWTQGVQETMCLDCAVAHSQSRHSHGGHSLKILCSRNIRALERRAKYLEEHSLLKGRTAGVHLAPPASSCWNVWIMSACAGTLSIYLCSGTP